MNDNDKAPTVYLPDGTPVKVRLVGRDCEGDVSGEGHFGYSAATQLDKEVVYFEEVDDDA